MNAYKSIIFVLLFPILKSFPHFGCLYNTVIMSMDFRLGQLQVLRPAPTSC